MRSISILVFVSLLAYLISCSSNNQNQTVDKKVITYTESILQKRSQNDLEMKNSDFSPIEKDSIPNFEGLNYYDVNEKWNIHAKYLQIDSATIFNMPTSTERVIPMIKDGRIEIQLNSDTFYLYAYRYIEHPEEDLFVPFLDLTNGDETYGGGRYIEVEHPVNDSVWIDFNNAYNPYCAYNHHYSCPIPPLENTLNIDVKVGEKTLYNY